MQLSTKISGSLPKMTIKKDNATGINIKNDTSLIEIDDETFYSLSNLKMT